MANQLHIIIPYRYHGTWVFDDQSVGLEREPFVAGVPEMIDELAINVPRADTGFRMIFSDQPFPGFQKLLTLIKEEYEGHWYRSDDPPLEGWLCPALMKYFDQAPRHIYVKAEPKNLNGTR